MQIELSIWTDKIERFRTEFLNLNECRIRDCIVVKTIGFDTLYALMYEMFNDEINYPEAGYYQLKACYEDE